LTGVYFNAFIKSANIGLIVEIKFQLWLWQRAPQIPRISEVTDLPGKRRSQKEKLWLWNDKDTESAREKGSAEREIMGETQALVALQSDYRLKLSVQVK